MTCCKNAAAEAAETLNNDVASNLKMKLISKSKLMLLLAEGEFTPKNISYEAYGRKVCAYISVNDMATRERLEKFLIGQGLRVDRQYSPVRPTVEVQISYFKAWHWDE